MSITSILADAVGAYVSQVIAGGALSGQMGSDGSRIPKWLRPIVVPKGAIPQGLQNRETIIDSPVRLTGLGFTLAYSLFLMYAAREMDQAGKLGQEQMKMDFTPRKDRAWIGISYIGEDAHDGRWLVVIKNSKYKWAQEADYSDWAWQYAASMQKRYSDYTGKHADIAWLHRYDESGNVVDDEGNILYFEKEEKRPKSKGKTMEDYRTPEPPETIDLFTAKRELRTLDDQDIAKSDDPLVACMERQGYTSKRMTELSDSIAEKTTVDMYKEGTEELTGGEAQFQEEMENCIDTITRVFGSLEAAGYEDCDCDN